MLKLPGGSKRQDAWETAAKRECDSATFESWEISWYIGEAGDALPIWNLKRTSGFIDAPDV